MFRHCVVFLDVSTLFRHRLFVQARSSPLLMHTRRPLFEHLVRVFAAYWRFREMRKRWRTAIVGKRNSRRLHDWAEVPVQWLSIAVSPLQRDREFSLRSVGIRGHKSVRSVILHCWRFKGSGLWRELCSNVISDYLAVNSPTASENRDEINLSPKQSRRVKEPQHISSVLSILTGAK